MARDALTPVQLPGFAEATADITPTDLVAVNGAEFVNTGRELLVAYNGNAGARTITVVGVASPHNYNNAKSIAKEVAASKWAVIGPFEPANFNQDGDVAVNSVLINVTVDDWDAYVVKLPIRN